MKIKKVLKENGYVVIEGYNNVMNEIKKQSDDSTKSLCSGYKVFPDGKKCNGCSDCEKDYLFESEIDVNEKIKERVLELNGTIEQYNEIGRLIIKFCQYYMISENDISLIILDLISHEDVSIKNLEKQLKIYMEIINGFSFGCNSR